MTITLSAETQKRLEDKLKSGAYGSADEVVHAALAALDEIEAMGLDEETLAAIDQAEEQIERGEEHDAKQARQMMQSWLGEE